MPDRTVVLREGSHTNVLVAQSPAPILYSWSPVGDLEPEVDYDLRFVFALAQTLAPFAAIDVALPRTVALTFVALQDHRAESAQTITYEVTERTGSLTTSFTVRITVLDQSTRDEYVVSALTSRFSPITEADAAILTATREFASRFLGPVNDPDGSNLEAQRALQYLNGLQAIADWTALPAPTTAPDYSALLWLAKNIDGAVLSREALPTGAPVGVLDALEGLLEGVNGSWRLGPTSTPMTIYFRAAGPDSVVSGSFRGNPYQIVSSETAPLGPGVLLVDKLGGSYVLTNKADGLLVSAAANVSLAFGDDFAVATAAGSQLNGDAGDDRLVLGDQGGTLRGGDGNDLLVASGGNNVLRGDAGDDAIYGGASFDDINGNTGRDTIDGGSGGNDWLVGGQGSDLIIAHAGNSILYGNMGADTLRGGAGDELIRGGQDDDVLNGGAGRDWLSGDRGDDVVSGGSGADVFHLSVGSGEDLVIDFRAAEGDRVMLDLGATYSVVQAGADVVISVGGGSGRMVLQDTVLATLPSNWLFAG